VKTPLNTKPTDTNQEPLQDEEIPNSSLPTLKDETKEVLEKAFLQFVGELSNRTSNFTHNHPDWLVELKISVSMPIGDVHDGTSAGMVTSIASMYGDVRSSLTQEEIDEMSNNHGANFTELNTSIILDPGDEVSTGQKDVPKYVN
jgi:hypothetical protein